MSRKRSAVLYIDEIVVSIILRVRRSSEARGKLRPEAAAGAYMPMKQTFEPSTNFSARSFEQRFSEIHLVQNTGEPLEAATTLGTMTLVFLCR